MKKPRKLPNALGAFVAITLLAPVVALAVAGVVAAGESPLESAADPAPLVATIESAERKRESTVAISLVFAEALSPTTNASGVLTTLNAEVGTTIDTGVVVAQVNGAPIFAYVSETPMWQDVYASSSGANVEIAQQVLTDLGYYAGPIDGKTTKATLAAMVAFNKDNGRGNKNASLTLASLVWVGPGPVTVQERLVSLGDTVSPGTELFSTTAPLAGVKVAETAGVVRDQPVTLTVNGIVAPYIGGSGIMTDPEATQAIAESLGAAVDGVGSITLVTPTIVGTIPASAIINDPTGAVCYFPDLTGAPIPVTPAGGTLGSVDVDASLVGNPILTNPREVREDLSCG